MQILYTPMFSKKDLNSDSNYVLLANFVRQLRHLRPDWHVYVPWPNSKSGFRYDPDGLFNQSNITRIPMSFYGGRHLETLAFLPVQWKKLSNSLLYHIHWANDIEKIGCYRSLVQSSDRIRRPIIIGHHHYMIHPSTGYDIKKDESILLRQLTGSIVADRVIFNSNHCKNMFTDMASTYLSSSKKNDIIKKSDIVHLGPALANQTRKRSQIMTIVYNHRLQSYKNYQTTFDLFSELWKEGFKFKVLVTGTSNTNAIKIKKYPFVEFRICLTHKEYLLTLSEADLNVTNSQHETFCISAVESMMFGQLLIAPNGVTFPEITGAVSNKYPFLFDSLKEQKDILIKIFKNPSLIDRWGDVLRDYVVSKFNQKLWAMRHITIMESELEDLPEAKTNEKAHDAFLSTLRRNEKKSASVFIQDLIRQNYFNLGQSWPMFRILKQLNQMDYQITNKNGNQILMRKHNDG